MGWAGRLRRGLPLKKVPGKGGAVRSRPAVQKVSAAWRIGLSELLLRQTPSTPFGCRALVEETAGGKREKESVDAPINIPPLIKMSGSSAGGGTFLPLSVSSSLRVKPPREMVGVCHRASRLWRCQSP